jgi:hypothetical protein
MEEPYADIFLNHCRQGIYITLWAWRFEKIRTSTPEVLKNRIAPSGWDLKK